MQTLKAGVVYFGLVFGAGSVLETVRVLWAVPRFGERIAELMEMPIMLGVTVVAAWWVVRRLASPQTPSQRLAVGFVALGLLLAAELMVVLFLRGLTIGEYVASRESVAGTVYLLLLGVFALLLLVVA